MKKASKIAFGALALSLVPFELKKGKDGSFSYRSLLLGVSCSKTEEGKQRLSISLFNVPDCPFKKPAQEVPEEQKEAAEAEVPAEEVEAPAEEAEVPAEETEAPAEEAPAEEPQPDEPTA